MSKYRHKNKKLFSEEAIGKMCSGDSIALGELVATKMNYVKTIIRNYASRREIEIDDTMVDDLAEMVWVKFFASKVGLLKDFH